MIGVSACLAVAAASQGTNAATLSASLRAHVQTERFGIVTSIRGLPLGVRDELQKLFGGTLDIAEPGAEFQATDAVIKPMLPSRRLAVAGCSTDHCLVYYQRGGLASTWHLVLFHWTPEATRFEGGGGAPPGMATIEALRSAILEGRLKNGATSW